MRPLIFVIVSMLCAQVVCAADLRIETHVYAKDVEEPISHSVTLFTGGVVYDFNQAENRVTVFRQGVAGQPDRFVLLDTQRELRTEIDVKQLDATMSKLRRWAAAQGDPYLHFVAAPEFSERLDAETQELILTSPYLTYRIQTTPMSDKTMGATVRTFLDHYAKLLTLLEAGLPPEPRLKVNTWLEQHAMMPTKVELFGGPLPEDEEEQPDLRAEHDVASVLSKQDRSRINTAMDQLARFRLAPNAEFQQGRQE